MMKKLKNGILFGLGLFILCMPILFMSTISLRIKLSEPTPTISPLLNASCEHPSPNGRFCGAVLDGYGLKVSDENGRILFSKRAKWLHFVGWTNDSRFVFFNNNDQYGNSKAIMIDTARWQMIDLSADISCWGASMDGDCRNGIVALAPQKGFALQGFGRFYDLKNHSEHNLFPNPEESIVWIAAWSPDESKLAFFGSADKESSEVTLFVADGNGENVTAVPEFTFSTSDLYTPNFYWIDDQTIQFQNNAGEIYRYQFQEVSES